MTLDNGVLPGPVTDERAHDLRRRYQERFGGAEFPVPVEMIAEDLLGLEVERTELDVSGVLVPAERRILVNAGEPETRQRFTIAHELGHWVCQCLEGQTEPIYCRAEEIGVDPEAKKLEREANVFAAELLMPEEAVREVSPSTAPEAFGVSGEAMRWRLYSFGLADLPRRDESSGTQSAGSSTGRGQD
jgi:Zn-dependent peptidase ImmA (M78 family)